MKKIKLSEIANITSTNIDRSEEIVAVKDNIVGKITMSAFNNTIAPIGFNLLIGSGTNAVKTAGDGKTNIVTRTSFYPLIKNVFYTLVFNWVNWGGGSIGFKVGDTIVNESIVSGNDITTVFIFKCPVDANSLTFIHSGTDTGNSHIRWSCLYQGVVNPPRTFKKSLGD